MAKLATIAPFGFDLFEAATLLPLYRCLGCRTSQFYRNPTAAVDVAEAKRIAEGAGLPFDSVHGQFGPELDPSSPDETIRRKTIEVYRVEADLGLRLGGRQIVVHPAPMCVAEGGGGCPNRPSGKRRWAFCRSVEELGMIGDRVGVTFLFENLPGNYHFGTDCGELAEVVRDVGNGRIRVCFDTGHGHMQGGAVRFLEACHDVVAYVHANDNDGTRDSHGIPGTGTLPWEALAPVMRDLPAVMPVMLELFESEGEIRRQIEAGLAGRLRRWLALEDV